MQFYQPSFQSNSSGDERAMAMQLAMSVKIENVKEYGLDTDGFGRPFRSVQEKPKRLLCLADNSVNDVNFL